MTCEVCNIKNKCNSLCRDMQEKLKNSIKNNHCYANTTVSAISTHYNDNLENNLYTFGVSQEEEIKIRKIIVCLLSKEQKQVLKLYAEGLTQVQIAQRLGTTQSNISNKFKNIRNAIRRGLVYSIEKIIE